jgi:uncharacterized protein (TIGR02145 family)
MNHYILVFFIFIFSAFKVFSQAPQRINFQSVIRNTNGELVSNWTVSLRISILSGSINGTPVYVETHSRTTDAGGLISLQIGNGTVLSGIIGNINWGSLAHFIKLEADFNGGNNYVMLGTQELMSVPYALYASKTDTSVLNLPTRLSTKLNGTDTASLSNRIDKKLNISDIASLLDPYLRPEGSTLGNIMYFNGSSWVNLSIGLPGQTLIVSPTGIPTWSGSAYATLTTDAVSSITPTSVGVEGNISADGGAIVTARGIVYGASSNPTLLNTVLNLGSGTGSFSGSITGLAPNTTYYVRAFATNSAGTIYGNEVSFQTSPVVEPILITTDASGITQTTVTSGGTISNDGGATITERGIVYGTISNPTISNSLLTIGSGTGSFSGTISGLTPNTTYYIRAYATNSAGTGYGNEVIFQALPVEVPSLITTDASGITQTTVTSGGTISNDGGATITERGIVYGTSTNPTTTDTKITNGSGTGSFTVNVTSLTSNTTYFIRSYAINSEGTGYGNNITFQTTLPAVPSLTTREISNITNTTATGGGSITNDGGNSITEKGICWSTSPNPTISDSKTIDGTGTATFTSFMTGLSASSTYYVRAYATNITGTAYGNQQTFTTIATAQTVTDIEGNTYNTVQIGTQVWMSENLKTSKYRNGVSLTEVNGNAKWAALITGAWSYYNDDAENDQIYGKLYNWYATQKNICPTGWGVPTDEDWTILTDYLEGESVAGGKMKSMGTAYWDDPNTDATNESGFSALPGGNRNNRGSWTDIKAYAFFWTATEDDDFSAWIRVLRNADSSVSRYGTSSFFLYYNKTVGASIRCLKN